jgi:hypothetical protein
MVDGDDEPTGGARKRDRGDETEPTGPLARAKTALTEAVGVAVDAVLDAL